MRLRTMKVSRLLVITIGLMVAVVGWSDLDFGDDSSQWARDGECDDPRFEGTGMANVLEDLDTGHDATDCRDLYEAGRIRLRDSAGAVYYDEGTGRGNADTGSDRIMSNNPFGDNDGRFAFDGECDDPRLTGPGMAELLYRELEGHDAADCRALFEEGDVWWDYN